MLYQCDTFHVPVNNTLNINISVPYIFSYLAPFHFSPFPFLDHGVQDHECTLSQDDSVVSGNQPRYFMVKALYTLVSRVGS